jgi:hypothetical protein
MTRNANLSADRVEVEIAKYKYGVGHPYRPALNGSHSGDELNRTEGLEQKIVRATVEDGNSRLAIVEATHNDGRN